MRKSIFVTLALFAASYLVCSFSMWNANPAEWDAMLRVIGVVVPTYFVFLRALLK